MEAIRAMGLKLPLKHSWKGRCAVDTRLSWQNQEPNFLKQQADAIGYPVLIKASAGGGGKGMRLVERSEDFLSSLTSCKSEARSSFGNEDVLIERYVTRPRHIEVQVLVTSMAIMFICLSVTVQYSAVTRRFWRKPLLR